MDAPLPFVAPAVDEPESWGLFDFDWEESLSFAWCIAKSVFSGVLCLVGLPAQAERVLLSNGKQMQLYADLPEWVLSLLLWSGTNPNCVDHRGNTILSIAVQRSHTRLARLLLAFGANPSLPCTDGYGPLHSSVVEGSPAMVKELLDMGASPFLAGSHNFTALHTAVAGGRYGLVELMIVKARLRSKEECVQGVNVTTEYGQTALHLAAHEAHINCLLLLLNAGCNVATRDLKGRSALDLAIQRGHLNCVQLLLKAGATKKRKLYVSTPEVLDELEKWDVIPSLKIIAAAACRANVYWTGKVPDNIPAEVASYLMIQD